MHKFTRESNGYTLTIELNEEELMEKLDRDIAGMEKILAEHGDDLELIPEEVKWDNDMCEVNGDREEDFCKPSEIIADRNEFRETIEKIIADNGETLWPMAGLKKNGTFKKNCKPTIREAINGCYWEDSYGWYTLVLRMVPSSDTLVRVEFDYIIIHY